MRPKSMYGSRNATRYPNPYEDNMTKFTLLTAFGALMLATPALAATARAAAIYKSQRFSDHAPLTIDYAWPARIAP